MTDASAPAVKLTNRLCFDMEEMLQNESYVYVLVWRPCLSKHDKQRSDDDKPLEVLRCDVGSSRVGPASAQTTWEARHAEARTRGQRRGADARAVLRATVDSSE